MVDTTELRNAYCKRVLPTKEWMAKRIFELCDEIDELRARLAIQKERADNANHVNEVLMKDQLELALYAGATVVEVEECSNCPLDPYYVDCDCDCEERTSTCQLRKGAVVVKMKQQ